MRGKPVSTAVVAVFLLTSPSLAADAASAVLKDASGNEVGKVELTGTPSGVLLSLDLSGLLSRSACVCRACFV